MDDSFGGIRVGQWNLNSFYQRKREVEILLNKYNLNVFMMNDTRCCDNAGLEIRGFQTERSDHPDNSRRPGGSAIIVKDDLSYRRIELSMRESVCIEISTEWGRIRLATTYAHPGDLIPGVLIEEITEDTDETAGVLLAGDMNAHVGLEENRDADRAGLHLLDLMSDYGFRLLNNDEPTYSSASCSTMSCIDLSFVRFRRNNTLQASWSTLEPGSSDHLATMVEVSDARKKRNGGGRLSIGITDWESYEESLENSLSVPENAPKCEQDIENFIIYIEDCIKGSLEQATRRIKVMKRDTLILSKESRQLIELRRKLLKLRRKWLLSDDTILRKILNKLSYDIKNSIKRDKDNDDNLKSIAILKESNPTKKWKLFRNFVGNSSNGGRIGDIVDLDGNRQTEDQSKARAFANKLRKSHAFPESDDFNEICKSDVTNAYNTLAPFFTPSFQDEQICEKAFLDFPADTDQPQEITPGEINEHLGKTNSKAAGGPDKITYKYLKKGGGKLISILCYLYNILLVTGYFPRRWRNVNVRMLHKSGKAKLPIANYRPISLSNCLSKLYESCIKSRFEKKLSRIRTENLRQSAYKKKRGTQENCLKLVEAVTDALNARGCVLSAFLDVSGAFDKVWREGLVTKVARWGIGRRLTRIIANFLSSRSLVVRVVNAISDAVYLIAGTPQGSVLSPILFNAFMDDVWQLIPDGVELLQYADDICVYYKSKDPKECERKIQETLDVIAKWAGVWRITMAPEKSSWMLFSRCPTHKKISLGLSMNNKPIPRNDKTTFLGILFDERLTWKSYLENMIRHATSKAVQIQSLSAKSGFSSPIQAINFFNSIVKPIFDYGAIAYFTINHNQWAKIDRFHGKFLRSVCGLPRCCSYKKLCNQLHQESLSIQIKDQAARRIAGICNTSPYADEWLLNRGYLRSNNSYLKSNDIESNRTYKSPVEQGLDRFLLLTTSAE